MTVKERINQFIDYKGIKINSFETSIGVSKSYWNNTQKVSAEVVGEILRVYSELSAEWVMTGQGEMIKQEPVHIYPAKYTEKKQEGSIKLYDLEASANLHTLFLRRDENILGEINVPNVPVCDGAVYVKGDSMYPLLKSGDIIAYKIIKPEVQNIFYGEMYLLSIDMDGDEYLTVKYVNRSDRGEEWIRLDSFNKYYEPKDFPLASVRAMALVKLSISVHTMK